MPEASSVIGVGLYTIPETASLLGRHVNTVRFWVKKGLAPAPVHLAFGETTILSFHDLISLMVVRWLTDEGVDLRQVRLAEAYLRTQWRFQRPFATQRIHTDGHGVFVALQEGGYTSADRWGQETLAKLMKQLMHDVTYSALTELAEAWSPTEDVMLRPDVQFGQACVRGTRLTTRTIAELVGAGDEPDYVASAYGVKVEHVRAAVAFEKSLLPKAA